MYAWIRRILVLLVGGALFGAGVAGWIAYFHYTDPETIRKAVLSAVAKALPGCTARIGSIEGRLLGGLRIHDFVLLADDGEGKQRELARFPEVSIVLGQEQLMEGRLRIKRLVFERPALRFRRGPDGRWDFERWFTGKPVRFDWSVDLLVKNGAVAFEDAEPGLGDVGATGVDLSIELRPPSDLSWKGRLLGDLIGACQTSGQVHLEARRGRGEATTEDAVDLAALWKRLPAQWKARRLSARLALEAARIERPTGRLRLHATGEGRLGEHGFDWNASAAGTVEGLGFAHPSLPYPMARGEGRFLVRKDGLEVDRFSCSFGPARVKGRGTLPGFDAAKMEATADASGVPFSDEVFRAMPGELQQLWNRFSPEGSANLHADCRAVDGRRVVTGYADLVDASLLFVKFPYPVEKANGRIELGVDGRVVVDARGLAGQHPVFLRGAVEGLDRPTMLDFELSAKGIPLDERLRAALPPSTAKVFDQFTVQGQTDVQCRISRRGPTEPVDFLIEADVRCQTASCEWFPYPLEAVAGHATITPHRSDFRDFVGSSRGATVQIEGRTIDTPDGVRVEVDVRGAKVPLDERLRAALPISQRGVWEAIRPEGKVDLWCAVAHVPGSPLDVRLLVEPKGAAVTPAVFPYRLHDLEGRIEYHDRRAWWKDVKARHGAVAIQCSGDVRTTAEGGVLRLTNLACPELPVDKDFRAALPPGLVAVADFLAPDRPLAASFRTIEVDWQQDNSRPPRYFFEGSFACANAILIPSVGLKNVSGRVSLLGQGFGAQRTIQGNLALDACKVASFQVTGVSGRLDVRDENLRVSNLQGDFYGGKVYIDLRSFVGDNPRYECDVTGYRARLASYIREQTTAPPTVDGLVDIKLHLRGDSANVEKLDGGGRVVVRQADIGGLPIIQDLFRILSLHAPNGRAFEEVDCSFTFQNRLAIIDRLELLGPDDIVGPSLSLMSVGAGSVNLDNYRLSLVLAPRYARGRLRIPLVSDLVNAASDNLVEIPVGGTLTHPVPLIDTLPGLKRMLDLPPRFPFLRR